MRWLKCVGVVVAAFVVMGILLIEPSRRMPEGLAIAYVNVGMLVMIIFDVIVTRRVLRKGGADRG